MTTETKRITVYRNEIGVKIGGLALDGKPIDLQDIVKYRWDELTTEARNEYYRLKHLEDSKEKGGW